MADDTGIQSALFLLLVFSDDEVRGISNEGMVSEYKSSISSGSSENLGRNISLLSTKSKIKKIIAKAQQKEYISGWFKKHINQLINIIDQVLSDHSFGLNSCRIAILFLSNIFLISKSITKSYAKKKQTFNKLVAFFDRERESMNDEELIEMEQALSNFYSKREIYVLTKRR